MAPKCTSSTFTHRFAGKRFRHEVIDKLNEHQRELVRNSGFGDLLEVGTFTVPEKLTEWIMDRMTPQMCEFRQRGHGNKVIVFTSSIVQKVLGVPTGGRPLRLLGKNDEHELRALYKFGGRYPIQHAIDMLLSEKNPLDDDSFIRTFLLVALATFLCVGTGNMLPLEFLGSLDDVSKVAELDWGGFILKDLMSEVENYQRKKAKGMTGFKLGGCLPLLPIVYMDFLDFPPGRLNEYAIDYSLPRACHTSDTDFDFVMEADRSRLSLTGNAYGQRPFRPFESTPYADASVDAELNVQATLDDWLHPSGSGHKSEEVPDYIRHIITKRSAELEKKEAGIVASFTNSLKTMHTQHIAKLTSELYFAVKARQKSLPSSNIDVQVPNSNIDLHIPNSNIDLQVPNSPVVNTDAEGSVVSSQPIVPYVGMLFDTVEEAEKVYNSYALKKGFGIRIASSKKSQKRGSDELIRRVFECAHARKDAEDKDPSMSTSASTATNDTNKKQRGLMMDMGATRKRKRVERYDCKAHMAVGKRGAKWQVTVLQEDHTHQMMDQVSRRRNYKSHKKVPLQDYEFLQTLHHCNISTSEILALLGDVHGGTRNLPYTKTDVANI